MKHLENYGVQELNATEMKTTDGGIIPIVVGVILFDCAMLGFMAGAYYELQQ
ncbi:MAG: class IIb bacteriocin, lactobin A/cerein 7B family [Flavobacteriaceae bacterium]|jgi:lactobin A/cerein 7B family class IIb bacteriocin